MKAFVLAAGLGTRLKPWTLKHPKALVPVGGIPMLQRVLGRLRSEGFRTALVNVHHFSDQIVDFLSAHEFGLRTSVSDESAKLLDTGGAIARAVEYFRESSEPVLIHNVDILSDAPLGELMRKHKESGRDITLLTSPRESSRKLIFGPDGDLRGWHNLSSGEFRPSGFRGAVDEHESAFSGIYIVNPSVAEDMARYGREKGREAFPVMDYLLENPYENKIGEIRLEKLNLIDIGKPDTLRRAEMLLNEISCSGSK